MNKESLGWLLIYFGIITVIIIVMILAFSFDILIGFLYIGLISMWLGLSILIFKHLRI